MILRILRVAISTIPFLAWLVLAGWVAYNYHRVPSYFGMRCPVGGIPSGFIPSSVAVPVLLLVSGAAIGWFVWHALRLLSVENLVLAHVMGALLLYAVGHLVYCNTFSGRPPGGRAIVVFLGLFPYGLAIAGLGRLLGLSRDMMSCQHEQEDPDRHRRRG